MPWQDRVKEAAYTSPSGVRIPLLYEDVQRTFEKKTTGFEFIDADGTHVQESGRTGRRYPWRVFLSGDDYDLEAKAFDAALAESGIGRLEHPIDGTVDVVPFGAITRRDDLTNKANQAVYQVTFWETIGLVYPSAQTDPASQVLTAIDEYNVAAAAEFEDVTSLESSVEQSVLKGSYLALLDDAKAGTAFVVDTQANVQQQFDVIYDSINQGIDILIGEPLTLAFQTTQLLQAPARALTSITARLDAFKNLATSIISGDGAVLAPSTDSSNSNKFHTNDLYASTYVTGSVLSVVNNQFVTKTDALAAAEALLVQLDDVVVWREANYASLSEIDTGSAYQQLTEAVALAAGFLVEISFTLKQERRITLNRARTIIDLAAELYGSVDDQLDFLISSNDLSGSEVLELPRGKEIVYYS